MSTFTRERGRSRTRRFGAPYAAGGILILAALALPRYSAAQTAAPIIAVTPGQISTTAYRAAASPSTITSIAEDPSGNVYVLDAGLGTLTEYPSSGSPVVLIGPGSSTSVTLQNPSAMAYSSIYQQLFITDTGNDRLVYVFLSPSGASVVPVTPFLSVSAGSPTSLNAPTGISVGGIGANVYVADTGNQRVLEFDSDGTFIGVVVQNPGIGATNSSPLLGYPQGIAVDRNGSVYVANLPSIRATTGGSILRVISGSTSTFLATGLQSPYGLTIDAADDLYISDIGSHLVSRVDILGDVVVVAGNGTVVDTGDMGPATTAGLSNPLWIALDPANRIFIPEGDVVREVDVTTGVANFTAAGTQSLLLTNPTDSSKGPQVGFEFGGIEGGTDPGDFNIAASSTCQSPPYANYLSPSASCTLGLSFTPGGSGQPFASLPFISNYDATAGVFSSTGGATQTILLNGPAPVPVVTSTVLAASPPVSVASGALVTLTATVTTSSGNVGSEGTVTFEDSFDGSSTMIGSATPNGGGIASLTTDSLALGTHSITANYADSANEFASSVSSPPYLLTVLPIISSVTLDASSVTGGTNTSGTVTLNGPVAPPSAIVTLSSNSPFVTVPLSITIPSGNSGTFTLTTSAVTSPTTAIVTASYDGSSETVMLTVNPAAALTPITIPTIIENIHTTDSLGSSSTLISATVISPIVENITTTDSLPSGSTLISAVVISPITENIAVTDALTPPSSTPVVVTIGSKLGSLILGPTNNVEQYIATLSLSNGGNIASGVQVTGATLNGASSTSLPIALSLGPSGAVNVTLNFPSSAGASGAHVVLSVQGTYSTVVVGGKTLNGSWTGNFRVTLPASSN